MSSCITRHEATDVATVAQLRLTDSVQELTATELTLSDMPDVLSDYVANVVVYIAGFVVRSLSKKLLCTKCKSALLVNSQTTSRDEPESFGLLELKDRGG